MQTLTLTSHYNGCILNLKLQDKIAADIMRETSRMDDMMDVINLDRDRVAYGYEPKYLSKGQVRKIDNFFEKGSTEYFDRAEIH